MIARDLTLEAARDASFARKASAKPMSPVALKKLLDSRKESDVLDGLRRVITVRIDAGQTLDCMLIEYTDVI
jgi:AP-3 complex subunit beta